MNRWKNLIVILVIPLLFFGCDNDDFAPYTDIDYDVSIHLNSNMFVIAEAKKELSQIAEKYAKDMPLTGADYEIGNTQRMAEFKFYRYYRKYKHFGCLQRENFR